MYLDSIEQERQNQNVVAVSQKTSIKFILQYSIN